LDFSPLRREIKSSDSIPNAAEDINDNLPPTKLLNNSKKLNIWFHYLARASVGGTISGVRLSKKTDYREEMQVASWAKIVDMIWRTKPPQSLLNREVYSSYLIISAQ
jgi:hypothetical protein